MSSPRQPARDSREGHTKENEDGAGKMSRSATRQRCQHADAAVPGDQRSTQPPTMHSEGPSLNIRPLVHDLAFRREHHRARVRKKRHQRAPCSLDPAVMMASPRRIGSEHEKQRTGERRLSSVCAKSCTSGLMFHVPTQTRETDGPSNMIRPDALPARCHRAAREPPARTAYARRAPAAKRPSSSTTSTATSMSTMVPPGFSPN